MWVQLITTRLKPGREGDLPGLVAQLQAVEQAGSGLVRSTAMQDQSDPRNVYMMVVFESEEAARARENDPRREDGLQEVRATMAEIFETPPSFVDLTVVAEVTPSGTSAGSRREMIGAMRLGIADHFGWAVAVTASADHTVVDRRRIELVEPGVTAAPIHYESKGLDVAATTALVAEVRASVARATSAAFDDLSSALPAPIASISLRALPKDFPTDIAVQRRSPYEARADAVMYRQVLAELAHDRGWDVHFYDAKNVERLAAAELGARADAVLHGPRATLGPPWAKDHRTALAATVLAG